MLKEIEGIIVSETSYGETSKIINVLTKDGIIGIHAKGAKTLKSPLRSFTQKLTYGIFQIYYKESKLSILKSVDIKNDLKTIKKDIILIGYLSYITDLTYQIMKQNTDYSIYKIFIDTILKINDKFDPKIISNIFEIKALDYLGVGINLDSCIRCGTTKNIATINGDEGGYICFSCLKGEKIYESKTLKMLRLYYHVDIPTISDLKISNKLSNEINLFISQYYDRYTGLYLKSKKFLQEIT